MPLQEARIPASDDPTAPLPVDPQYFVDRERILRDIQSFLEKIRLGQPVKRSFVIKGNSGWGKSSLVLKLASRAQPSHAERISITGVDSRVAKDRSFVFESIRIALLQALDLIRHEAKDLRVREANPLSSTGVVRAFSALKERAALAVLVFDQFEDFVIRRELGDALSVVGDLVRDLERTKPPFAIGFTWKTDLSSNDDEALRRWEDLVRLMEQFLLEELTIPDVWLIVETASKRFAPQNGIPYELKSRIVDQSVNYPWLAKKLLTHVFGRIAKGDSPKTLLAGNLAVEGLFNAELQELNQNSDGCLRFVAKQGAMDLAEAKDKCPEKALADLVKRHLLVRAGTQYRVSWEILREYLANDKVPPIPFAPPLHNPDLELMGKAFTKLRAGPVRPIQLRSLLKIKKPYFDRFLEDLLMLGLVELVSEDRIRASEDLESSSLDEIARVVGENLKRHDVYRAFAREIPLGGSMPSEKWNAFFINEAWRTKKTEIPGDTWEPQSRALRRWLQFAGLIEEAGDRIVHPQAGRVIVVRKAKTPSSRRQPEKLFVGNSKPSHLKELVARLRLKAKGMSWKTLERATTGNAIRDAIALGLAEGKQGGAVYLTEMGRKGDPLLAVRSAVEGASTMLEVKRLAGDDDPEEKFTNEGLGGAVGLQFGKHWTANSAERVGTGLISFHRWLGSFRQVADQISHPSRAPSRPLTKPVPEEISVPERKRLIEILVHFPGFAESRGRRALVVDELGLAEHAGTFNFEGNASTVASELIGRLLSLRQPELFERIRDEGAVSSEDRKFVAEILEKYAFTRVPAPDHVPISGSPSSEES
jgi:hypothetical protein